MKQQSSSPAAELLRRAARIIRCWQINVLMACQPWGRFRKLFCLLRVSDSQNLFWPYLSSPEHLCCRTEGHPKSHCCCFGGFLLQKFPQFRLSERENSKKDERFLQKNFIRYLIIEQSCDQRLSDPATIQITARSSSGLHLSKIPNRGISTPSVFSFPARDFFFSCKASAVSSCL